MSGTVSTALKFGAALFLVLAIIGIAVNVFSPATEAAKVATTDFSASTTELKDQKYLIYDNTTISGSQVVNALRKFQAEGEAGNIAVEVITGTNGGKSYFGTFSGDTVTPSSAEGAKTTKVNDSTSKEFINPSGMFKATVERDTNSVIRLIKFTQDTLSK